jgi:hypothetical protein
MYHIDSKLPSQGAECFITDAKSLGTISVYTGQKWCVGSLEKYPYWMLVVDGWSFVHISTPPKEVELLVSKDGTSERPALVGDGCWEFHDGIGGKGSYNDWPLWDLVDERDVREHCNYSIPMDIQTLRALWESVGDEARVHMVMSIIWTASDSEDFLEKLLDMLDCNEFRRTLG